MIKSVGKSKHECCDHKTSRNTTAEMRKIFVWGRGGVGYLQMGRLRIRKKKKKWGRRVSAGGQIFTFSDGLADGITPSVNTSVNPSLTVTGHRHVTARTCFFKSLSDSIGIV